MNRAERIAAMADDAERLFRPTGASNVQPLVEWLPASSPVMRQVRSDLEKLAKDPSGDPELRSRVRSVLNGDAKLSSLLEPGGFPLLEKVDLPKDAREVIDAVREGELK